MDTDISYWPTNQTRSVNIPLLHSFLLYSILFNCILFCSSILQPSMLILFSCCYLILHEHLLSFCIHIVLFSCNRSILFCYCKFYFSGTVTIQPIYSRISFYFCLLYSVTLFYLIVLLIYSVIPFCSILLLFHPILFSSILFYSTVIHSVLLLSIPFHSTDLFYYHFTVFYSTLPFNSVI